MRSYAYFVAEQVGLALSPEQALCAGRILSDKIIEEGTLTDVAYEALVSSTFEKCSVNIGIPTTTIA